MKKVLLFLTVLSLWAFHQIPIYQKADLLGKLDPEGHVEFTLVPASLSSRNIYLRNETVNAFVQMAKAAQEDGIHLMVISGTRNFNRQKEIWEDKWHRFNGKGKEKAAEILTYSSMPGTSRHHWGTDFDLNSLEPSYFESGQGKKIYEWLDEHAWKYGFFQPYNKLGNNRNHGYKEEKWHWSYFPIANQMLRAYNHMISYEDLNGYKGAEFCEEFDVFKNYVNAIYIPQDLEFKIFRQSKVN